jgi:hypothetical protein
MLRALDDSVHSVLPYHFRVQVSHATKVSYASVTTISIDIMMSRLLGNHRDPKAVP